MSVYFLRHGDLVKIGYSSDLRSRVRVIMSGIPGEVTFIGHMPGDRELEAHLHSVFAGQRFAGEWFRETDAIRQFCDIALIKLMPEPEARVLGTRHEEALKVTTDTRERLRAYALAKWPGDSHAGRVRRLAVDLGWLPSRVQDFYHGAPRAVLRATEAAKMDEVLGGPASVDGDAR